MLIRPLRHTLALGNVKASATRHLGAANGIGIVILIVFQWNCTIWYRHEVPWRRLQGEWMLCTVTVAFSCGLEPVCHIAVTRPQSSCSFEFQRHPFIGSCAVDYRTTCWQMIVDLRVSGLGLRMCTPNYTGAAWIACLLNPNDCFNVFQALAGHVLFCILQAT